MCVDFSFPSIRRLDQRLYDIVITARRELREQYWAKLF